MNRSKVGNHAAQRTAARWVGPAVVLVHALALLLGWRVVVVPNAGSKIETATVLLAAEPIAQPPPTLTREPSPRAAAPRRDRLPPAAPAPRPTPPPPMLGPAEPTTAIRPDDAASEPLLDHAATQRAIRESVRQPGLAARARDEQGANPPGASVKLGNSIEQAAHGDCAKGDYAGAGMGLLSLPFWAVAELRGKCAR